jgi:hypothetical protein
MSESIEISTDVPATQLPELVEEATSAPTPTSTPSTTVTAEPVATPAPTQNFHRPKFGRTPPPQTPAPTNISTGVLVGKTTDRLGTEASQQVQNNIAKETTAGRPVLNTFQDLTDQLLKTGSMKEKTVIVSMRSYIQKMAPGLPLDIKDGVFLQQGLWKLIQTISNTDDDFDQSFKILIDFFREYKGTTLSERYIFRFVENMTMGSENIRAFQSVINIIMIAATTINKRDVKKQVDLNRALNSGLTEEARQRIISYFS